VRPDAAAIYFDGRVARTEIMSAKDIYADLFSRNTALDLQLQSKVYTPLSPQVYAPKLGN
jgi:hypothetical protein